MTRAVANSLQRQRRQAQPPQHALLAPCDERERDSERGALGDRHRQQARHEQVDVVDRLRLDALGDERHRRLRVHGAEIEVVDDAADDAHHDRRLGLGGLGVDEPRLLAVQDHGRRLVAVTHALQRPLLVGCGLTLMRSGALERLAQRAGADDVDRRPRRSAAAEDQPEQHDEHDREREREEERGPVAQEHAHAGGDHGADAVEVHSRNAVPVASRKTSSSVGWRTERPRISTPRCSASATSPSSVRCGSSEVSS